MTLHKGDWSRFYDIVMSEMEEEDERLVTYHSTADFIRSLYDGTPSEGDDFGISERVVDLLLLMCADHTGFEHDASTYGEIDRTEFDTIRKLQKQRWDKEIENENRN